MEESGKETNPNGQNQSSESELKATTAILLIGHGSRASGANDSQLRVAGEIRDSGRFLAVECAFLEISQPNIPAGLTLCRAAGATRIVVIPYFLHLGTHVQRDLPRIIGEWWQENSEIEILEGAPLGYSPRITALVEERIGQALSENSPR